MSIEAKIDQLIAALDRNTAAHSGAVPAAEPPAKAPAKTPAPAEKVRAATAKPTAAQIAADAQRPVEKTVTQADIKAAGDDLSKLAEIATADDPKAGRNRAVAILGEFGVKKMTDKPENIPAIHAKVKKALQEFAGAADDSLV